MIRVSSYDYKRNFQSSLGTKSKLENRLDVKNHTIIDMDKRFLVNEVKDNKRSLESMLKYLCKNSCKFSSKAYLIKSLGNRLPIKLNENLEENRILKILLDKEIDLNESLSKQVKDDVIEIIKNYNDCFARDISEVGRAKGVEMNIELTDCTPIYYRPYRLAFAHQDWVREQLKILLK